MTIRLNGEATKLPAAASLADAVRVAGAKGERGVAAAVDGEVVPRAEWAATPLREGQSLEVVRAVQGG
jgi:sulfur carrier protein